MSEGIAPFGDHALRFPLLESTNRRALFFTLRAIPGVVDVVLAEDSGAVVVARPSARAAVLPALAHALARGSDPALSLTPAPPPAHHTIRVVYDGDDLALVATSSGLSIAAVTALHAGAEYEVAMVGFLPGFAYLRGLDPRLVMPRRAEPRTRVPPGSVAMAAEYTGIYPFASPGGWHLLGRAVDHRAFDAAGATLALGDRVRFVAQPQAASTNDGQASLDDHRNSEQSSAASLEVRRVAGLAIVVDAGRAGHMHEGVPHGAPMAPARLARANAAAGNEPRAAALEIYGVLEVVARGGSVTIGDDTARRLVLRDGDAAVVATDARSRMRYLAVLGGIDVPVVLGGRGTLLVAGLGGYRGRGLRRGDVVATAEAKAEARAGAEADADADDDDDDDDAHDEDAHDGETLVDIVDGPDVDERVMEAVARGSFRISPRSDRIGTRLEGDPPHPLPNRMQSTHARAPSRPMVQGAIELTPAGLVVLGPDHPTTGGYPVIAVVPSRALGRLLARPIGARVRLVRSTSKLT